MKKYRFRDKKDIDKEIKVLKKQNFHHIESMKIKSHSSQSEEDEEHAQYIMNNDKSHDKHEKSLRSLSKLLIRLFDCLDLDNRKLLTTEEMYQLCNSINLSYDEATLLLKELDAFHTGCIQQQDFDSWVKNNILSESIQIDTQINAMNRRIRKSSNNIEFGIRMLIEKVCLIKNKAEARALIADKQTQAELKVEDELINDIDKDHNQKDETEEEEEQVDDLPQYNHDKVLDILNLANNQLSSPKCKLNSKDQDKIGKKESKVGKRATVKIFKRESVLNGGKIGGRKSILNYEVIDVPENMVKSPQLNHIQINNKNNLQDSFLDINDESNLFRKSMMVNERKKVNKDIDDGQFKQRFNAVIPDVSDDLAEFLKETDTPLTISTQSTNRQQRVSGLKADKQSRMRKTGVSVLRGSLNK